MGAQKDKYVIDIIVIIMNNIYKAYQQKKIVRILVINIEEIFNNIFRLKLAQ